MRVLLIPTTYPPAVGGLEINVLNLAKHLKSLGHDVVVLTSKGWYWKFPSYEVIEGVPVHRTFFYVYRGSVKSFLAFLFCLPIALTRTFLLMRRFKPDIVNVHGVGANCFCLRLLRPWTRVPTVVTVHGVIELPGIAPESFYTATEAKIMSRVCVSTLRHCSFVVGVSQKIVDLARKVSPQAPQRFLVIRGGADIPPRNGRSENYGNYALLIGRMEKVKGFDVLVRSLALLPHECDGLHVLVAGDGPEKPHLESLSRELGVESRLTFLGMVDRPTVHQLLKECRFLVVPSRSEGLGTVNLEALAHSKPVIASAVGGIPEIIKDGETGLLVKRDDPEALANALIALWSNPEQGRLMGERGRAVVEKECSWEGLAARYVELYERLLMIGGPT
jgi:glycosyltransferase involved in cell wall biosynthesis